MNFLEGARTKSFLQKSILVGAVAAIVACGSDSDSNNADISANKVVNEASKSYRLVSVPYIHKQAGEELGLGEMQYHYTDLNELLGVDFVFNAETLERHAIENHTAACWRIVMSRKLANGMTTPDGESWTISGSEDWVDYENATSWNIFDLNASSDIDCDSGLGQSDEISALNIQNSWVNFPSPEVTRVYNDAGQLTKRVEQFSLVEPQPSADDPMTFIDTAVSFVTTTELLYTASGLLDVMTTSFVKTNRETDVAIVTEETIYQYTYPSDLEVTVDVEQFINHESVKSYSKTAVYEQAACGDYLFERALSAVPSEFSLCLIKE